MKFLQFGFCANRQEIKRKNDYNQLSVSFRNTVEKKSRTNQNYYYYYPSLEHMPWVLGNTIYRRQQRHEKSWSAQFLLYSSLKTINTEISSNLRLNMFHVSALRTRINGQKLIERKSTEKSKEDEKKKQLCGICLRVSLRQHWLSQKVIALLLLKSELRTISEHVCAQPYTISTMKWIEHRIYIVIEERTQWYRIKLFDSPCARCT